jgi:hypothetical protein
MGEVRFFAGGLLVSRRLAPDLGLISSGLYGYRPSVVVLPRVRHFERSCGWGIRLGVSQPNTISTLTSTYAALGCS